MSSTNDQTTENADSSLKGSKLKKFIDVPSDKNCLQAPDNEGSPSKKKKEFIEPNLKAFMERNMPKLKVFANITDMKTWKKKH